MKKFIAVFVAVFTCSSPAAWAASRCTETVSGGVTTIACSYQSKNITGQYGDSRQVKYQVPTGTAPAAGWPVVVMYQGSFFPVEFTRNSDAPYGGFNEVRVIRDLLDHGYAVLAPRTASWQAYWDTNTPNGIGCFTCTADYRFLNNLFSAMQAGSFGKLDMARQYAAGISSGGYNTSRMAVSFAGRFKALAIESASYATCSGPYCNVPATLPADHPPTLFLHGMNDNTVPWCTMNEYYDRLLGQGIPTRQVTDPNAGHQWINAAPDEVRPWFDQYP